MSGLEHYDDELFALDQKIMRLAISCGIDLAQNNVIVSLIKGDYSVCSRGDNPKRETLRGLLMMKYKIEKDCVDSLGVDECYKIVNEVESKIHK